MEDTSTICGKNSDVLNVLNGAKAGLTFTASGLLVASQSNLPSPETAVTIKLNFVALVRGRTIPTERPPPVGEVSANFCG